MNKLIVVNKRLNFYEKIIFLKNIKFHNIKILDLTYNENIEFYKKNKIFKKLLKNNIFENKNFFLIEKIFKRKIKNSLEKNPELLNYKFTELNFSDFWWKLMFKTKLIDNLCKKKKIKEVKIFEKFGSNLSSSLNEQNNIKYIVNKNLNFNLIYYWIYFKKIWFINLIYEILSFLISKKCNIKKNSNYLVFSNFPYGWVFSKKTYNKFFGNKISFEGCHLLSLTRNNQYQLNFNFFSFNKLNKLKRYNILENNGSIKNIIFNYFLYKKDKENLFKKINYIFENGYISSLLVMGILNVEIPKNNVFYDNFNNFFKINKIKKIIHYLPEFVDGRIINKIANKHDVQTLSLQHSSLGILQYSRFITMIEIINNIDRNYLSKKILVENDLIAKKLNKINSEVKVVGNHRVIKKIGYKRNIKKNIFYIAEMHNLDQLKDRILKVNKNFKNNFLYIRLHPGKKNVQKKIIENIINKNIIIDDQFTLNESLSKIKPFIVFTSSPTVYKELILNYIKVVLIKDSNFFTNYPLDINYRKILRTTSFKNKDFQKKIHSVPTKFFGKFAENRIYRALNEK